MLHRLPPAYHVDRIDELVAFARGRRVIHIGFADHGFREMQEQSGAWLHEHLDRAATSLVGIDVDEAAVADARRRGLDAVALDCTDASAVSAAGVDPAQVVVAGEVIEHLDRPGDLLEAVRPLVAPGGELVITTPNAYGWLNPMAALAGFEVNHPDHVCMFTCRTLTTLLARHGWEVSEVRTYSPAVKSAPIRGPRSLVLAIGARIAVGLQRVVARLGRPYVADGLIVVARAR